MEKLGQMTPEELEAIQGIGPGLVEKIQVAVNSYYGQFEEALPDEGSEAPAADDGAALAEGQALPAEEDAAAVEGQAVPAAAMPAESQARPDQAEDAAGQTGGEVVDESETEAIEGEPASPAAEVQSGARELERPVTDGNAGSGTIKDSGPRY